MAHIVKLSSDSKSTRLAEGHQDDARVATALAELQKACAFYKCLGSYPAER